MRLELLATPHPVWRGHKAVECPYVVIGVDRKHEYFETRDDAVRFINDAVNAARPVRRMG